MTLVCKLSDVLNQQILNCTIQPWAILVSASRSTTTRRTNREPDRASPSPSLFSLSSPSPPHFSTSVILSLRLCLCLPTQPTKPPLTSMTPTDVQLSHSRRRRGRCRQRVSRHLVMPGSWRPFEGHEARIDKPQSLREWFCHTHFPSERYHAENTCTSRHLKGPVF